jgi:hypothetical protein
LIYKIVNKFNIIKNINVNIGRVKVVNQSDFLQFEFSPNLTTAIDMSSWNARFSEISICLISSTVLLWSYAICFKVYYKIYSWGLGLRLDTTTISLFM